MNKMYKILYASRRHIYAWDSSKNKAHFQNQSHVTALKKRIFLLMTIPTAQEHTYY